MLVSNLDYSDYLGRIAYGRITSGRVNVGDSVVRIAKDGRRERANITAIFSHQGLAKIEVKHASEGDIVGITGFEDAFIGETLTDTEERLPLAFVDIDPPTISMGICINDSPLAGREGKLLTARQIRERLVRETRTNVGIQFADTETAGHFEISARGEMQIAVLVEQMRREGFELLVSRPEVIFHRDDAGNLLEPIESLYVDVPPENLGDILQSLAARKAEIINMEHLPHSVTVQAVIPTRGLIGFETDLVNVTKGHGIMSHLFKEYGPFKGEIPTRNAGVLVSMEGGISHRLRARFHPGARPALHRARRGDLRGHDRRRKLPPRRHAGKPLQGQKALQHALDRRRQRHPARPAPADEPRARPRIHRPRRIRRGDAQSPCACAKKSSTPTCGSGPGRLLLGFRPFLLPAGAPRL